MGGYYGHTIVDGVLQYVSPTQIEKFNPDAEGGCPRKWAFEKIARLKPKMTAARDDGIQGHGRIEHHLKTGEMCLTSIELAGKIWIPPPLTVAPGTLLVEREIKPQDEDAIKVAGLPMVQKIDCLNGSGIYVTPQGESVPTDLVEVIDWKFSGEPRKWAKSADVLREALPMNAYAAWALARLPQFDRVRVSHVNFATKKRDAFKVAAVITAEEVFQRMRAIEPVVERMKLAASLTDPNDLEPNWNSCGAFGGCSFQNECRPKHGDAIRSLFGKLKKGNSTMGLMDKLKTPVTAQGAPAPAPAGGSRLAGLLATEAAAKATQVPPPPPAPDYAMMFTRIDRVGMGRPTLTPALAQRIAEATGKNTTIDGNGRLATITIASAEELEQLAGECDAAPASSALQPPDSPAPSAATSAEPLKPEVILTLAPAIATVAAEQAAAAAAAESTPAPATEAAAEQPAKRRGRPPKNKGAAEQPATPAGVGTSPGPVAASEGVIDLYVDCVPYVEGAEMPVPLDGWLDELAAEIAGEVGCAHLTCQVDGVLSHGKWKGLFAAVVSQRAPGLKGGSFVLLNVRGDEMKEVAARALRPHCRVFVRGV